MNERHAIDCDLDEDCMCRPATERCPTCGHEDDRHAFEGWEGSNAEFVVRCPACEAAHPDQTDTPVAIDG